MTTRFQAEKNKRRAATVLEVLFATFVIVVGLIGIASIIPLAARNALEANAHTSALSLGLGWADSFFARGFHQPNPTPGPNNPGWVWYRDYAVEAAVGQGWENFMKAGYQFDRPGSVRVNASIFPFESRSFSAFPVDNGDRYRRIWGHLAVCIDPFTLTSDSANVRIANASTRVGSYRLSVFPYFNDRYDPALDPFAAPTLTADQPRMLRVGIGYQQAIGGSYPHRVAAGRGLIANLFSSVDDMIVDDSPDLTAVERSSRPPSRFFVNTIDNVTLKAIADGRYTWMATVVPQEPRLQDISGASAERYIRNPANTCLVSFLVLNRHSHEYVPVDVPNPTPGDVDRQPTGERLTRVYPLSGDFVEGAGGRVRIIAADTVRSDLSIGDWIMLGRDYLVDPAGRPYPYLRWYRVVALSSEASYADFGSLCPSNFVQAGDPISAPVWSRDVVLEGPDFPFGSTPTFGTIVSGVVTVVERQVRLQ